MSPDQPTRPNEDEAPHSLFEDERVRQLVHQRLLEATSLDPARLEVEVGHGVVTLRGSARDASLKLTATRLTCQVPGVAGVENELRVELHRRRRA